MGPRNKNLVLAIPSKGRLQEQVTRYLADAGLSLVQSAGARDYRAKIAGMQDIDVKLLSSADIAEALAEGEAHLGVTGEDLLRESVPDCDRVVALLQPLGFGFADVVVAVPRAWIDVATMADLDDVCTAFHMRHHRRLRVATKYTVLTRAFFAAHGIADYRTVESLGATEGAPAAGVAEAIVDITTTGATLAANDLKILDDGVILKSQAQLAASLKAPWANAALAAAGRLTARFAARELARSSYLLRLPAGRAAARTLPALAKLGCAPMEGDTSKGERTLLCPRAALMNAVAILREAGAGAITAEPVEYIFRGENPLFARLNTALAR